MFRHSITRMKRCATSLLIYCGFFLLLTGCHPSDAIQQEGDSLLASITSLQHRHHRLDAQVDSLWDTTVMQLEKYIPSDFPPVDRKIFLTSRNADHIRMFMTFHQLPEEAQALINHTGLRDQQLANQVLRLQQEMDSLQKQKLTFLSEIAQKNKNLYQHYSKAFNDPMLFGEK